VGDRGLPVFPLHRFGANRLGFGALQGPADDARFGNVMSPFLRRTPIGRDDAFDGVMVVAAAPSRDTSVYKSYPADIPFTTCNILRGVFRGVDRIEPKLDVADSLYRPRRAHNYADFLAAHAEP